MKIYAYKCSLCYGEEAPCRLISAVPKNIVKHPESDVQDPPDLCPWSVIESAIPVSAWPVWILEGVFEKV